MDDNIFRAGAAKVEVTPPLGTLINGDFTSHYAYTIHDPLYAKALVMARGGRRMAIVVVDICAMGKDFVEEVKGLLKRQLGIAPGDAMIASTHTHAAGSVEGLLLSEADLSYRKKLPGLILDAVRLAVERLGPAQVAFGSTDVPEHVVCRRFYMKDGYVPRNPVTGGVDKVKTNPFGAEEFIDRRVSQMDTSVGFMAVQRTDGKWISLLANYSMHYVGDWPNGTITADYFGEFSNHVHNGLGGGDDFVCMMSNGTSGEASIWDFVDRDRYPKEHFAKSRLIGRDIGDKVLKALKQVSWDDQPVLDSRYMELSVGVRKPSAAELAEARRIVAETIYEDIKAINDDTLRQIYAREQVLLNEYPDRSQFPVQLLHIGRGMIGGLGGEFFAETGLALKKGARDISYFTITLANGYVGYVPPAHEIEAGGYETWRCRTSHLEYAAEERIRKQLATFIREI